MRYFVLIISSVLFIACFRSPPVKKNEINKIVLARSGAWSFLGDAVSIDSSLKLIYFGKLNGSNQKYYAGKTTQGFWDTLNIKLERIKYKSLPDTIISRTEDAIWLELIVYTKKNKKHFIRVDDHLSDSIVNICKWVNSHVKNIKLTRLDKPVSFETTLQNPPQIPKLDQVKFPPPVLHKKTKSFNK